MYQKNNNLTIPTVILVVTLIFGGLFYYFGYNTYISWNMNAVKIECLVNNHNIVERICVSIIVIVPYFVALITYGIIILAFVKDVQIFVTMV